MARLLEDWLETFLDYSEHTEAPKFMRTWAGVSAIASCLRKKVWIDNYYFRWTPNFFVIFVAPPGIVAKSTTADIAMDLVREVPGVKFGPDIVTWQSLVTSFAGASESFQFPPDSGDWHPMSAITLVASELGNLINPKDKEMVNLFINLWDGRKRLDKQTKMSGTDIVESPWINLIACTTPHWIADNMPAATVGGGFTSRCVFLYADEKAKFVAYPKLHIPKGIEAVREALIHDLEYISMNLCGEYILTPEALIWGEDWYKKLWSKDTRKTYDDDQMNGYVARKQTHTHKLAMILAASRRDELSITAEDLQVADVMLSSIESEMPKVFSRIGRTEESLQAEKFIAAIVRRGSIPYADAYKLIHAHFPDFRDFEGVLNGAIRSGQIIVWQSPKDGQFYLKSPGPYESITPATNTIVSNEPNK